MKLKRTKEWNPTQGLCTPTQNNFKVLTNRRVVDNLEKNGDTLTKARPVQHWIYFKTKN
jgi:hypothetical protein